MAANIQRVVPSQRRHYRVTTPILIFIEGVEYRTLNWSISGFKIGNAHGFKAGDTRNIYIKIPFQGFDVGFLAKALIVRCHKDTHEIAGEFIEMDARRRETLAAFVQGLVSGEMSAIGGVIKRLDLPATPAALQPPGTALPPHEVEYRRRIGMRLYAIAGAVLTVLLLAVLYANFFQLRINTAVIMGRNDIMVARAAGDVTYMADLNKPVPAGETLIVMEDERLEDNIQTASFAVRDATVEADRLEIMLDLEKQRLEAASGIISEELDAVSDTIATLKKNLELKRTAYQRLQALDKQGYISKMSLDKAQIDYLETERQLNVAREEEAKRKQAKQTITAGFQVREDMVHAGVHDIEALRKAANERLANAQANLEALKQRQERLAIKAPAEGRLVRIFTPVNSSAKYGEPMAIFERTGTRVVQAFVTQDEALRIANGQEARIYFPSRWGSIPVKVTDIDFYSMTLGQSGGLLQWQNFQNDKFKTVVVTLEPVDEAAMKAMQQISSGTASTVVFTLI